MCRVKSNSLINAILFIMLISCILYFVLYARIVFPRKEYEGLIIETLKISIIVGLVAGIVYLVTGDMLCCDRKKWGDMINSFVLSDMGAQESPHFPLPGYRSRACSGL